MLLDQKKTVAARPGSLNLRLPSHHHLEVLVRGFCRGQSAIEINIPYLLWPGFMAATMGGPSFVVANDSVHEEIFGAGLLFERQGFVTALRHVSRYLKYRDIGVVQL